LNEELCLAPLDIIERLVLIVPDFYQDDGAHFFLNRFAYMFTAFLKKKSVLINFHLINQLIMFN